MGNPDSSSFENIILWQCNTKMNRYKKKLKSVYTYKIIEAFLTHEM